MHSDTDRQFPKVLLSLNKNQRQGCTIFSLSSSPAYVSLLPLLFALFPVSFLPHPSLSVCVLLSNGFIIASFFPIFLSCFAFFFFSQLPQIFFYSCTSPRSVSTSNRAGSRAVSLGVDAAAEYQTEGKTGRQKKGSRRERESSAVMSQLRRDLPT